MYIGVDEKTTQDVNKYLDKVSRYSRILQELEEIIRDQYGLEGGLCALSGEYMKNSRGLVRSLQEAKRQALLDSDKKEIEEAIQIFSPLINIFGDLGESLLANSTEEQIAEDDCLSDLIDGALS